MKLPTRRLNQILFYLGVLGLGVQLVVSVILLLDAQQREWHWWFHLTAPLVCILWGIYPPLQLQKEPK